LRFSPLLVDGQLQGFEACTAHGAKLSSGALIVHVGPSSVMIEAHVRPFGTGCLLFGSPQSWWPENL
jgi:hypothetical protein